MAENRPFDAFRLTVMQDVLPVGLAMVERVRKGGPAKAVEGITNPSDLIADLRDEGAPAAKAVRERLDQVSPGLGNPVVQVDVEVDPAPEPPTRADEQSLPVVLARIERNLDQLQRHLAP
ncbi:MAG: hypothetical protein ACON4T_05090 [Synechococcus sp.]